jgi:mono/diheme cytochrome c family protein
MGARKILAGAAALAMLSAVVPAHAATPASIERGRRLVARNCGMCHAIGAAGQSRNAQAPAFRELHRAYPVEMLAEALADGMLANHPAMPQFRFSQGEILDIIDYLQSIQTKSVSRQTSPSVRQARRG